jgi:three-Cys-motif partner protein
MERPGMGYPTHAQHMPKVDFSLYRNREQAYVKHCLMEEYLPDWAYKVGSKWDSLVYVDGFAGPWQTKHPDYADSSFGIAVDALRRCQLGLREGRGRELHIECILVEQDESAFSHLKRFATASSHTNFIVHALPGKFITQVSTINELVKGSGRNPFRFVFLDPKGWADIPMDKLQPLLGNRSCEVLINLMTRHINRFLDQTDRENSYQNLFGRQGVVDKLRNTPSDERVDRAVQEYSLSLKLLCKFKYVSSAVILEPNEEAVRYYLVYATNHPRGVEVFKAAENKAAKIQDDVRQESRVRKTGGQLEFPSADGPPKSRLILELLQRYLRNARNTILTVLRANTSARGVAYADLFCEAMSFPLVTPNDLVEWLRALEPNIRIDLGNVPSRRKPKPSEDYRVVVINPKALR